MSMYSQVVGFTSKDVAAAWAGCGWTLLINVVMMMMNMMMMLMQAPPNPDHYHDDDEDYAVSGSS